MTLQCLNFDSKRIYTLQTDFTYSNWQVCKLFYSEWRIKTPQFQGYIFSIFSVIFWFCSIGKRERNIYSLLRNIEISQQNSKLRNNFENWKDWNNHLRSANNPSVKRLFDFYLRDVFLLPLWIHKTIKYPCYLWT